MRFNLSYIKYNLLARETGDKPAFSKYSFPNYLRSFLFLSLLWAIHFNVASAATIYLNPSAESVYVGDTFSVDILVSSPLDPINVVEAVLPFPSSVLDVVSISKDDSIIDLWIQNPSLLNSTDTIYFVGGIVSPGFQGDSGKIATVIFKVKNAENTSIAFDSAYVLASDGQGTNALTTIGGITLSPTHVLIKQVLPSTAEIGIATTSTPVTGLDKFAIFDISSEPIQSRVAPGELLSIPVTLSNFGGGKRVDVLITYSIVSSTGKEIYSTSETVAVETTASFVKTIQIPFGTVPGIYTANNSVVYKGQLVPATANFPFTIERKILGLFQSDFIRYGGITILVSVFGILLGHALIKRRRRTRFAPFDYSDKPKDERIYYEIVSDTIGQMRQRAGDRALKIAIHTPGLVIDNQTGQVLTITESPAKVVAKLVSEYEKSLGKKVSFTLRK